MRSECTRSPCKRNVYVRFFSAPLQFAFLSTSCRHICDCYTPIAPFLNNHTTDTNRYEGSLDDFVTDWLDGTIAFGKWTDHLKSWYVCQAALQNSAPPWQLVVDARAGDMLLI